MDTPATQTVLDVGIPLRKSWRLSPSDFAFLWDECPRCFYLKHVHAFVRPSMPFPRVFAQIDAHMKTALEGRRLEDLFGDAPLGVILNTTGKVESRPISLENCESTCFIQGSYDALAKLDEGGYLVIDYKTTLGGERLASRYSRQLHAYAWALENALPKAEHATPVRALALVLFRPEQFEAAGRKVNYCGELRYLPIPRDDDSFRRTLTTIVRTLDHPEPPGPGPGCEWCRYRAAVRRFPF